MVWKSRHNPFVTLIDERMLRRGLISNYGSWGGDNFCNVACCLYNRNIFNKFKHMVLFDEWHPFRRIYEAYGIYAPGDNLDVSCEWSLCHEPSHILETPTESRQHEWTWT